MDRTHPALLIAGAILFGAAMLFIRFVAAPAVAGNGLAATLICVAGLFVLGSYLDRAH